jgi:predicted tellurium resistance membrane protein TerC
MAEAYDNFVSVRLFSIQFALDSITAAAAAAVVEKGVN